MRRIFRALYLLITIAAYAAWMVGVIMAIAWLAAGCGGTAPAPSPAPADAGQVQDSWTEDDYCPPFLYYCGYVYDAGSYDGPAPDPAGTMGGGGRLPW